MGNASEQTGPLRLAELVAALSLATDLGTGQPLEHALRTCMLSLELARRSGVAGDRLTDVYYVALLRFVGCTADAAETAATMGGDDLAFIAAMSPAFMGSPGEQVRVVARLAGADQPVHRRIAAVGAAVTDVKGARESIAAHCEAAQLLSARLGVSGDVTAALEMAYERWDGKGLPRGVAGEAVAAPARVVIVARDVDLWTRLAGVEAAVDVVRRRRGRAYDPAVARAFLDAPSAVLAAAAVPDAWAATLDTEPPPWVRVPDDRLPATLAAFADFADLKSPWLRGHSPAVAELAAGAGRLAGLADDDVRALHLAGLVHDVGRVGVANGIWDAPGPLGVDGWEKVRLHSYLGERILSRSRRLAPLARLASCHHERVDGSGYHRGTGDLTAPERLLGAADAYQAMTSDRAHRPAMTSDEACDELRRAARDGEFHVADVEAVAEAAGHRRAGDRNVNPAGLTDREVEVLRLIARGRSNREAAAELVISPKTVGSHIEHIYAKAGVSTRAGAALFAMEHGLL